MTEKLKQIIKEEIEKLQKETRDAINSCEWVKITEEIGKKFSLEEDEIASFQLETLLILTGLEYPNLYDTNIIINAEITRDEAKAIIEEVNQKIFIPINNIFTENIKKNLKGKNPTWEQNLNFVISGGDYSAFIDRGGDGEYKASPETNKTPIPSVKPPTLADIQANTKSNVPVSPAKIADIKSKFVI